MKKQIIDWIDELPKGSRIAFGFSFFVLIACASCITALWLEIKHNQVQIAAVNTRIDSLHLYYAEKIENVNHEWIARLQDCQNQRHNNRHEINQTPVAAVLPKRQKIKNK